MTGQVDVSGKAPGPAGPRELQPPKDIITAAEDIARQTGARITVTDSVAQAVAGADFIHTDVWVSMGEPSPPSVSKQTQKGNSHG